MIQQASLRAGQVFGGELIALAPHHGRYLCVIKRAKGDYVLTHFNPQTWDNEGQFYWSHYDMTFEGAMNAFSDDLNGEYNQ